MIITRRTGARCQNFLAPSPLTIRLMEFLGAEEYDDFGPLRGFNSASRQQHQLFGVFDFKGKPWNLEGGAGVGLTGSTDRLVV